MSFSEIMTHGLSGIPHIDPYSCSTNPQLLNIFFRCDPPGPLRSWRSLTRWNRVYSPRFVPAGPETFRALRPPEAPQKRGIWVSEAWVYHGYNPKLTSNNGENMGKWWLATGFMGFRRLSGSFPSFSDKPISKHQQDLNVVSMSGSPRTSAHAIELAWNQACL